MKDSCHYAKRSLLLTLLTIGIIFSMDSENIFDNSNEQLFNKAVYAHNFTPNESASFLAFAEQLQVESELVQTNLANNNVSLAEVHAEKAAMLLTPNITKEIAEENRRIADELTSAVAGLQTISTPQETRLEQQEDNMDAILSEAISARIEQEQRENSTIRALALANIVDSILRNYGNAYSVNFDMTNMSNMAGMSGMSEGGMSTGMNTNMNMNVNMNMSSNMSMSSPSISPMIMGNDTNSNYSLTNAADYQSAQALAIRAQEIHENELDLQPSSNITRFIDQLGNSLFRLIDAINSRASPMEVMTIVHTQIHPNLMQSYNLRLQ
jgi:hypothetical protein